MNFIDRIRKLYETGRLSAEARMQKRAQRVIKKLVSICDKAALDGRTKAGICINADDNDEDLLRLLEEALINALIDAGIPLASCRLEKKLFDSRDRVNAIDVWVTWV